MSYALLRPWQMSSLGVTMTELSKLPSCDTKFGSDTVDSVYKSCCEQAKRTIAGRSGTAAQIAANIGKCAATATATAAAESVCLSAKTGVQSIDTALEDCCHVVASGGGTIGERTKALALCAANAAANVAVTTTMAAIGTAACAAAGAVTAGITTVLAATGICGIIGGAVGTFLYNRIAGYSTGALIVGGLAAAVCGAFSGGSLAIVCGFLAAELTQWLSDTLGPVLERVFDPNAAARRAYERRQAFHRAGEELRYLLTYGEEKPAAGFASLAKRVRSQQQNLEERMRDDWSATIERLWVLYDEACPTQLLRDGLAKDWGIRGSYQSLAQELVAASNEIAEGALAKLNAEQKQLLSEAGMLPMPLPFMKAKLSADPKVMGCETFGRHDERGLPIGYPNQPRSPICPPMFLSEFIQRETSGEFSDGSGMFGTWIAIQKYKQAAKDYQAKIRAFFEMLPNAEAIVAGRIATWASTQALARVAQFQATAKNLVLSIKRSAVTAEAAAIAAGKGDEKESAAAVLRAKNAFKVADEAYSSLMKMAQSDRSVVPEITAAAPVRSATQQSAIKAEQNYAANKRRRFLLGVTIAAGVAGSAYVMLRKES